MSPFLVDVCEETRHPGSKHDTCALPHIVCAMSLQGTRDPWLREFNEARQLGDDCFLLLQERNAQLQTTADAAVARLSAASRRKLNALNSKIDRLESSVAQADLYVRAVSRRR